jgi:CBS domain-containing protein
MKQVAYEIMTKKITTIAVNDSVRKAYQIMREKNVRHLPVIDSGGDIIGIISNRDLQRAMIPTSGPDKSEASLEFDSKYEVRDFMSWPVRTIQDDSLIQDVAVIMLKEKISAVIVIGNKNSYRGIITTDDLLSYLTNLIQEQNKMAELKISELVDNLQI